MEAMVLPSFEVEIASSLPRRVSSPVQMVSATRVDGSSVAIAVPPSTVSSKRIFPVGVPLDNQRSQAGEPLRLGVRLCGSTPPDTGIVKISPPVELSSLMMPPMKAISFPSGEKRGLASCMSVL